MAFQYRGLRRFRTLLRLVPRSTLVDPGSENAYLLASQARPRRWHLESVLSAGNTLDQRALRAVVRQDCPTAVPAPERIIPLIQPQAVRLD